MKFQSALSISLILALLAGCSTTPELNIPKVKTTQQSIAVNPGQVGHIRTVLKLTSPRKKSFQISALDVAAINEVVFEIKHSSLSTPIIKTMTVTPGQQLEADWTFPIGEKYIISAQAMNAGQALTGGKIYAYFDVIPGRQTVQINWRSTAPARMIENLINQGQSSLLDSIDMAAVQAKLDSKLNAWATTNAAYGVRAHGSYADPEALTNHILNNQGAVGTLPDNVVKAKLVEVELKEGLPGDKLSLSLNDPGSPLMDITLKADYLSSKEEYKVKVLVPDPAEWDALNWNVNVSGGAGMTRTVAASDTKVTPKVFDTAIAAVVPKVVPKTKVSFKLGDNLTTCGQVRNAILADLGKAFPVKIITNASGLNVDMGSVNYSSMILASDFMIKKAVGIKDPLHEYNEINKVHQELQAHVKALEAKMAGAAKEAAKIAPAEKKLAFAAPVEKKVMALAPAPVAKVDPKLEAALKDAKAKLKESEAKLKAFSDKYLNYMCNLNYGFAIKGAGFGAKSAKSLAYVNGDPGNINGWNEKLIGLSFTTPSIDQTGSVVFASEKGSKRLNYSVSDINFKLISETISKATKTATKKAEEAKKLAEMAEKKKAEAEKAAAEKAAAEKAAAEKAAEAKKAATLKKS